VKCDPCQQLHAWQTSSSSLHTHTPEEPLAYPWMLLMMITVPHVVVSIVGHLQADHDDQLLCICPGSSPYLSMPIHTYVTSWIALHI
jgi:hypothetical protein